MKTSLSPEYFDDVYRANDDPWNFAASPYEEAKYSASMAALPRSCYTSAFEIGCSIGVLTERLASRCEQLLAVDVSERALDQARERCKPLGNVRFEKVQVPVSYPDGLFELTVLSEVGYYWSRSDLVKAARKIVEHMAPAGHLLLVHWTPPVADYPLTGEEVHEYFRSLPELSQLRGNSEAHYRLDLFERSGQPQAPFPERA